MVNNKVILNTVKDPSQAQDDTKKIMTFKTLKTNFERELILQLILNLKLKKIDDKRAKGIAKVYIDGVSNTTEASAFLEKISKLSPRSPVIMEAYLRIARKYEEESVRDKIAAVAFYLQKVMIEEALSTMKSADTSLNASGIVHTRIEEPAMADSRNSNHSKIREEFLEKGN